MTAMFGQRPDGAPVKSFRHHYEHSRSFRQSVNEVAIEKLETRIPKKYRADSVRTDAMDLPFFARQFESFDKRVFQLKYAELKYRELLPLIPGIDPLDDIYTWNMFESRGRAQFGLPQAGVETPDTSFGTYARELSHKIHSMTAGFSYSILEMQKAAKAGVPIDTYKAAAATRAVFELQNRTALFGNTEYSIQGLLNLTGTLTYTPSQDTNNATAWQGTLKTSLQIANDLIGMVHYVRYTTKDQEAITNVLMPQSQYLYISSTPFAPGAGFMSSMTILKWVEGQCPGVKFDWLLGTETAGSGNVSRVIAYSNKEDCIGLILPVVIEPWAPKYDGMGFSSLLHARMGDVVLRRPYSVCYMDGI